MSKKITVTLSDNAERQFNELEYSLDLPHKRTSQSDIVNHCMEECLAFEEITDDQITNYLATNFPEKYTQWLKDRNVKQYNEDGTEA
jgi:hypothetical protein